jgi:hypothetical protein
MQSPQTLLLKEKIDAYFSALNKIEKFNGVVFVSKNDKLIIDQAYNLNSDTSSTTYITTKSQFDIHSVSKLMARYLVEKYETEGKVKKEQTLNDFIQDFPNGEKISIDMLLNHTSGLPRSFEKIEGDAIELTSAQIIEYAKKQKLIFEPGTDYQYSNVAYEVVYWIIQEISNKTFAQCLYDEVFKPLRMKSSGAHFHIDTNNLKGLAKNHEKRDSLIIQVDNILSDEFKTARIFSTSEDLNKFLNHLKNEPYASLLKDDSGVIEKSGGNDGIRVEIYTNLNEHYNFVFLANYDEVPFQKTVEDLANILENRPYEVPKAINRQSIIVPIDILEQYTGTYYFADLGNQALKIDVKNEALAVYQDEIQIGALKAETNTLFFENPKSSESFEFLDDGNDSFYVLMGFKGVKLKGVKK